MYHFQSKKGLIREIAEDYVAAVFDKLRDIREREPLAKGRLLGLVGIFESMLEQERMCLCGVLAADAQELDEPTRELVEHFFDRLERWVAQILQEQKGFDLSRNQARREARVILSSLEGALLLDRSEGTPKRLAAVKSWIAGSVGG